MYEELVGRRHYIITCLEDDVALRELEWHILFGIEAVSDFRTVIVLVRLGSVGIIAVPEKMGKED